MNRQPLTRRLSIGTLIYKRAFPYVFLAGGVAALTIGVWNAWLGGASALITVLPFIGVAVAGFFITRLNGCARITSAGKRR